MWKATVVALGASLMLAPAAGAKAQVPASVSRVREISPSLARDTEQLLYGDIWKRQELSVRDRSLVTIAVLVTTGNTGELKGELERALDNGVTPTEIGAALDHLAFYAGWPRALAAIPVAEQIFRSRRIVVKHPAQSAALLPLPPGDTAIKQGVTAMFGPSAPRFAELTNALFDDLWRRPELAQRDRSLVTLAVMGIAGDPRSLAGHVERALDFGLTESQIVEEFTHLAFYAGWDRGTAAIWEATQVFAQRKAAAAKAP